MMHVPIDLWLRCDQESIFKLALKFVPATSDLRRPQLQLSVELLQRYTKGNNVVITKFASSPDLFIHGCVWCVCSYHVFVDPDYIFSYAAIGPEQQCCILLGDMSNVEQSHPMRVGNLHGGWDFDRSLLPSCHLKFVEMHVSSYV
jgi:hypothetical protein